MNMFDIKMIYCPKCDKETKSQIVSKNEEYKVRGEKFSIKANICICDECKEEVFCEELDKGNLQLVYDQYREKHQLLKPDQIRNIRRKYGLSQRAISRLLEWGEITYTRYENGTIQDAVHNEVLEFIEKPENMLTIYEKKKDLLSVSEKEGLSNILKQLISNDVKSNFFICCEHFLASNTEINEYTGYKEFDLEKMKNMILYIAEKSKGILKTKMNKLLWYTDFLFFKVFSVSISGSIYVHLPYGPIPDNYDFIIALMIREGLLEKEEVVFNQAKGIVGEGLRSKVKIKKEFFETDELKIMDFVLTYFDKFTCAKISEYSHKETPYQKTAENEKISYSLAKELSLDLK